MTMPDISDTLITQLKQWQRERLVLCSLSMRTSFPYILPDIRHTKGVTMHLYGFNVYCTAIDD